MVKSLSVMGITDSDFPMSSIIGRANLLLTTSIGSGVHVGIKHRTGHNKSALNCTLFRSISRLAEFFQEIIWLDR